MTERITATPDPANPGSQVCICYETDGAELPIDLRVQFDPNLGEHVETIDADDVGEASVVCFVVTVPAGCQGALVVDKSGQSEDCNITVTP